MKLLDYINSHENWQKTLTNTPYYLSIKHAPPYYLLKYDMLQSDFSYPEVLDARGLIIRYDGNKYIPVSFGLRKFFNATEKWASPLDWSTVVVQEKVDGSNIRFAYDTIAEQWLCSTMGTPDARKAQITNNFTFFDAVLEVLGGKERYNEFLNLLNKNYTYIFELVSKYNIICCHYSEQKLYYISRRNMQTEIEELEQIKFNGFDDVISYPQVYPLISYENCVSAAETLTENHEGFVCVDAAHNRVKIKSPWYIASHKMRANGPLTVARIVELWQNDSLDDFIAYFPEHQTFVDEVVGRICNLINAAETAFSEVMSTLPENRGVFARHANSYDNLIKPFLFARLDNKVENAAEFYKKMNKLSSHLGDKMSRTDVGLFSKT